MDSIQRPSRFSHRFQASPLVNISPPHITSAGKLVQRNSVMAKKFALVVLGLMLTVSSVGCCCLGGYGYGAGYGMNRCAPCNNGCAPGGAGTYYPPQTGAIFPGAMTTAYAGDMTMSQTAYVPSSSTFVAPSTAAAIPGAIVGQPIYTNTAVVPTASLPLY